MHCWLALGAPTYEIQRHQWVPRSMEEVFAFFKDPYNLPNITPAWLGFQILDMQPDVIQEGTRITYRLHWMGIPYRWRTLITEWVPGERFVDIQSRGPYILWHHTHTFTPCRNGVTLTDQVRYRLPFGPLGALLHRIFLRRQLEEIFDYRVQKIAEQFSEGDVFFSPPLETSGASIGRTPAQ